MEGLLGLETVGLVRFDTACIWVESYCFDAAFVLAEMSFVLNLIV
jgi:hypothetical protein